MARSGKMDARLCDTMGRDQRRHLANATLGREPVCRVVLWGIAGAGYLRATASAATCISITGRHQSRTMRILCGEYSRCRHTR